MDGMRKVVRTHGMSIPQLGRVGLLLRVQGGILCGTIEGNVRIVCD
jgi:hypothetical protein